MSDTELYMDRLDSVREAPAVPVTVEDTGLSAEFIVDLILKTLYVQGARTGQDLTEALCLPFPFVDEQLLTLQQRRFVEVLGTTGANRGSYVFDLATEGRGRAREAMDSSRYVGPAPVPLDQYVDWVKRQSIQNVHVTARTVQEGFNWLVLDPDVLGMVGPAINSARSLFLYGEPGDGKTAIAETIAAMMGGSLYVPHAIEVDGQIIQTYDPVHHRSLPLTPSDDPEAGLWLADASQFDARFVRVGRPVVLTGGELMMEQLDLQYDHHTKMYQAPFQVKANGGVLIIDDFGRQRVPPRDLLNRWIVPLEKRVDYLTLHTGGKFPVPFDCLLIFATNIDPRELTEEAFLRRIHYKVHVLSPDRERYEVIFRRYAAARQLEYQEAAVEQIYREWYGKHGIPARGCHPRDLLDHLCDIAKYLDVPPALTEDLIDRACRSYFLDFTKRLRRAGNGPMITETP